MKKTWQLQQAKSQFSQVVKEAAQEPQYISVHGKPAAVLVSIVDYRRMKRKRLSLVAFLRRSPLIGVNLRIKRRKSPGRDIVL